ncbi:MAG: hypothetical protein AB1782_01025 [Cyanobacteriota bacterium]
MSHARKTKVFILSLLLSLCSLPLPGCANTNIEPTDVIKPNDSNTNNDTKQIKHDNIAQHDSKNPDVVTCYAAGPMGDPPPLSKTQLQEQLKNLDELHTNKKINTDTYNQRKKNLEAQLKDMYGE